MSRTKNPLIKPALIIPDAELVRIYTDTFFPDYPPETLKKLKVDNEIYIQSDRVVAHKAAQRFADWLLSKRQDDSITLNTEDIKMLEAIQKRELKAGKSVKFNLQSEDIDATD